MNQVHKARLARNPAKAPAHEYGEVDLASWIQTARDMNPGQRLVVVRDEYGVDVVTLTSFSRTMAKMSDDERDALLACDSVTLLDGTRVEMVKS